MKKLANLLFVILFMFISINSSSCGQKYRVSQEEYERAFNSESLSNVSISIIGPYWERYHTKEEYYIVDECFVYCRYQDDLMYYGEYYEKTDEVKAYYLYGSEEFETFTPEVAIWREAFSMKDENSFMHNAEFVRLYRRDYHLLEYNRKEQCYQFDFVSQGYQARYSYFFEDAKLVRFEVTIKENGYNLVWHFYNYGQTNIPEWAGKNE